jgi:hypothetical protein
MWHHGRYSDERMGWISSSISERGKTLSLSKTSKDPTSLLFKAYGSVLSRVKCGRGIKLTAHLRLVLRLRMSRTKPLLLPYASWRAHTDFMFSECCIMQHTTTAALRNFSLRFGMMAWTNMQYWSQINNHKNGDGGTHLTNSSGTGLLKEQELWVLAGTPSLYVSENYRT